MTITSNIAQLRYLAQVARAGSISAAARACHVSQPTVSNAVADLEKHVGGRLFKRTTRGVEPTPLCNELLRHVDIVLSAVEDLDHEIEGMRNPRKKLLRVAFSPALDSKVLMALGATFAAARGGVEVIYKECTTDDLRARVYKGQVDVVVAPRIVGEGDWARRTLYRDRIRFVPTGGVVERPGVAVTLADVARHKLLLTQPICGLNQTTRSWFEQAGIPVDEYLGKAMSYSSLLEWALQGLGACLLPESKLPEPGRFPLLVDDREPVTIAFDAMWSREMTFAAHVRDFVGYLAKPAARLFAQNDGMWMPDAGPGARTGHPRRSSVAAQGSRS